MSEKASPPSPEDIRIELPSRLRIHQRMGHMPPRFQRELGGQIEALSSRRESRTITLGQLVTKVSSIITESAIGQDAATTSEAVEHYMPKVFKQLIDNPDLRSTAYSIYEATQSVRASERPEA